MARYAIVENGVVVGVSEWDGQSEWSPPEGQVAYGCSEEVQSGWTYADDEFTAPSPPVPSFDELKLEKRREIDVAFRNAVLAGVAWNAKVLQIDDISRSNISGSVVRALAVLGGSPGVTWPQDFAWRMADNSWEPLTAIQMIAMGQAASNRYIALRVNYGNLKDSLEDASDQEDLDGIDPDSGW